ncbi:hypothetical protein JL722_8601 [Aureococcus anophagefferens]|nr:hypothetical protein JL722_8601 [Aureococcus anophagefferens]
MALAARLARRRSFAQHRDISTLILLRHGTSEWNGAEARFSGWCDIPLTVRGRVEAVAAGQLLRARGFPARRIDVAFASELQRAHETCELALASMAGHCQHTWSTDRIQRDRRLNERHYGALQGHFRATGLGRGLRHPEAPGADCQRRVLDCFEDLVKPALFESANRAVLLVAHSNTLRALMAAIDEVPDDDVPALHVPNSVPILYRFDVDRRAPVSVKLCKGSGTQSHARWMLTPENHAQVHDALESGGLLTRAFFESVDVKRNGAVSVRELDLSLTAYLKEAELGNNRIDCAVTAVAKKIVRERDSTITPATSREVAAAAAALPKRDDQNQQAGAIRKGHIKEFLVPSSAKLAAADESGPLDVVAAEMLLGADCLDSACAYVSPDVSRLPAAFRAALERDGDFHVHAHEHPAVVQRVAVRGGVPPGAIALSEVQRLNNRVCVHDDPTWTLYRGSTTLDAREAAMGATAVARAVPDLDAAAIIFEADDGSSVELVARVVEVRCERDDDDDGDDDGDGGGDEDDYRGRFATATAVYAVADGNAPASTRVEILRPAAVPPARNPTDYVDVVCAEDDEVFPVRRALLRPCLALTRAAQAGRGKYDAVQDSVSVPLDCCTFDRVLLYLQHERRREPFAFDPTLAPELLRAAEALKIRGLEDAANKVDARNAKGGETDPRGETWLVLDGMVLDITRWLGEHPGGNTIIPQQALGCDCAVMFEIYHVSRQSFAYLREFYVGELHRDDAPDVPPPATLPPGAATAASPAFLAELRRHTAWRLKDADLVYPTWKSF